MPPVSRGQPDPCRRSPAPRCCSPASTTSKQEQIVLAYQRYGRGKALALPIQDSWLWQMDAEDAGHRHDARDVLAAPGALAGRRRARSGQRDDDAGSRRAGRSREAHGRGRSTPHTSRSTTAASSRASRRRRARRPKCRSSGRSTHDGEYRATFVPDESGVYDVKVTRRRARSEGARHRRRCTCASRPATRNTSTRRCARRCCKRIAEETGGRFFTPANAASLPEAISYSGRGVTVVEERDLWDMPALLLAAARPDRRANGRYRRVRGLA